MHQYFQGNHMSFKMASFFPTVPHLVNEFDEQFLYSLNKGNFGLNSEVRDSFIEVFCTVAQSVIHRIQLHLGMFLRNSQAYLQSLS